MRLIVAFLVAIICTKAVSSRDPNLCDAKRIYQCDDFATCCQYKDGSEGCCPFTAATCCPQFSSCCPSGFECSPDGCLRISPNNPM
ncbi:unnamed protein product [Caenorhabditis auriculariae]|uniref:Granulins domain-containing protein n=1 Tax=Caenorhabditis auriculariae TaxID=2777116 RepID=A0A8S1HDQ5_9PELO|nr:unnamed protein product [Caenorhabditis auriculariae]